MFTPCLGVLAFPPPLPMLTSAINQSNTHTTQESEDFFSAWGNEGTVDICDALSDLIILTASRCLHGDDVRQVRACFPVCVCWMESWRG